MITDIFERGLERLICTALTGAPCDPDAAPEEAVDGTFRVEARLEHDTVWLTGVDRGTVRARALGHHLARPKRVSEGKIGGQEQCAKFAHTAADGKTYRYLPFRATSARRNKGIT